MRVDIPPVECGEEPGRGNTAESPDSQVRAHLAGQVRSRGVPAPGALGRGAASEEGCARFKVQLVGGNLVEVRHKGAQFFRKLLTNSTDHNNMTSRVV